MTNGITGDSQSAEYDNAWVGGTERDGGKREKWQTGSSWTSESRAAQETQAASARQERKRGREKEGEKESLSTRGSQAAPLLCRRSYEEKKDRVA